MVSRKELVKIFKPKYRGWVFMEELTPDELKIVWEELRCNTGRVGVYVYHSHQIVDGTMKLMDMKMGLYLRSRNPFSWRFRSTAGNE